jgi:hypothetical protein
MIIIIPEYINTRAPAFAGAFFLGKKEKKWKGNRFRK